MSSEELRGGRSAPVVRLSSVSKVYGRGHEGVRWRSAIPLIAERPSNPLVALDALDLVVRPGDAVGIIGPNGAGKSTALKVLAGVTEPTSGSVEVRGMVRSMIELGVGFHPELTGRENAWSSLVMHGFPVQRIRELLPGIEQFAGIGDAMSSPIKQYSLGMQARLAFAVATCARPDVLVIDEVLAVGDQDFQIRCIQRIEGMVDEGTALVFVSHEMPLVAAVCDRVLHMRRGRVVDDGPADEVVERYLTRSSQRYRVDPDLGVSILGCRVPEEVPPWGRLEIEVELEVRSQLREPKVGIDLFQTTVEPDRVACSYLADLNGITAPGVYVVNGVSRPIGFANARARMSLSVVDGITVADVATRTFRFTGDRPTPRPELSVLPEFVMRETSTSTSAAASPPRGRRTVNDPVVQVHALTKTFRSGVHRTHLRAALPGRLGVRQFGDVRALDAVDLEVGRGEAVGVIGPNGSGKSTLLRCIAGLHRPDAGAVQVSGAVLPVLDLGVGLHPELTGRENTGRLAALLGVPRSEQGRVAVEAIEFSGLADAVDVPVRQYSSGMRARLAMAVALAAPGRILLIDELLAVGDEEFRRDLIEEIGRRVHDGATVVFVSHELSLVEQLCDRVVRLDAGRVVDDGPASDVIDAYGGSAWGGGVHDATSGVRLFPLWVRQRHVGVGGRFDIRGRVEVDVPSPFLRLEMSYRAIHGDRPTISTAEDRTRVSFLRRTLEPAGGALARGGVYDFELGIDRNEFAGAFDIVISVIDERDESVCTESFQELMVGEHRPEGFPGPVLEFDWSITRLGGPIVA